MHVMKMHDGHMRIINVECFHRMKLSGVRFRKIPGTYKKRQIPLFASAAIIYRDKWENKP